MTAIVSLWSMLQHLAKRLSDMTPAERKFVEACIAKCLEGDTRRLDDFEAEKVGEIYNEHISVRG